MLRRELELSIQEASEGSDQAAWARKLLGDLTFAESRGFKDRQNPVGERATRQAEQVKHPYRSNLLARVIKERLSTPDKVTDYWRDKLQSYGVKAGIEVTVPECDWKEEEIRRPMLDIEGNQIPGMMVYVPVGVGLQTLDSIHPELKSFSYYTGAIWDTHEITGWVKVEATIDAPNRNTTERDLLIFAQKTGYLGQRRLTYILASHVSRDLAGRHFDQSGTKSRLVGSRGQDSFAYASFLTSGRLKCYLFSSSHEPAKDPLWGGRFQEVKEA